MIYQKIYQFCSVKNLGNCLSNTDDGSPRVSFILDLLKSLEINYKVDKFQYDRNKNIPLFNIILPGSGSHWCVAHHDIVNQASDNANDNSCSVINLISLKLLRPDLNICFTDAEEIGGLGAQRLSDKILEGELGPCDWILNLELSGRGGTNFFIGDYPGALSDKIIQTFDPPVVRTPFNDSVVFRRNGIDSCVINTLPVLESGKSEIQTKDGKYLDFNMLFNCHSKNDSLDKISPRDMSDFVEKILINIV